jgi:hypothetical protein
MSSRELLDLLQEINMSHGEHENHRAEPVHGLYPLALMSPWLFDAKGLLARYFAGREPILRQS